MTDKFWSGFKPNQYAIRSDMEPGDADPVARLTEAGLKLVLQARTERAKRVDLEDFIEEHGLETEYAVWLRARYLENDDA
jgi:hypothetical protein